MAIKKLSDETVDETAVGMANQIMASIDFVAEDAEDRFFLAFIIAAHVSVYGLLQMGCDMDAATVNMDALSSRVFDLYAETLSELTVH